MEKSLRIVHFPIKYANITENDESLWRKIKLTWHVPKWVGIAFVILVMLAGLAAFAWRQGNNMPKQLPIYSAVAKTLAQGGPVKDDLIRRGLFVPATGSSPGELKLSGIDELVRQGIYAIDPEGFLIFGPAYMEPTTP